MHIAFVNATRKWGGVKTWCLDMGTALQEQGHAVRLYGRPGEFISRATARGLVAQAVRFGPDFDPRLLVRFARDFRRFRIDRVVVNVGKDLRTAGLAARCLRIPIVQHLGAPGDLRNTWKTRTTQRLLAPHLLACSEFVRGELRRRVPSLADADFIALHPGTPRGEPPAPTGAVTRVVVSTSRLDPDKGHDELFDAAARLAAAGVDFRIVLVGTGAAVAALRAQATRLGLDARITWAGFHSDVRPFLRAADVFVLPSRCEPLGIALQEAMAAGLVPVARRAGGVPEIWPAGMDELLWSPADGVTGLQRALERTLTAPAATLDTWKRRAWEHAGTAFDLATQGRRFAAWLESLAAVAGGPGPSRH